MQLTKFTLGSFAPTLENFVVKPDHEHKDIIRFDCIAKFYPADPEFFSSSNECNSEIEFVARFGRGMVGYFRL